MPRKKEPSSVTEQGIFPTRLRQLMEERKTTQKVLAQAVGVRPQTISLYTTGQSYPDVNGLRKIAQFYNVSADWLLGLTDHQTIQPDIKAICEYLEIQEYNLPFLRGFFHHDPEHANYLFENPYFQSAIMAYTAYNRFQLISKEAQEGIDIPEGESPDFTVYALQRESMMDWAVASQNFSALLANKEFEPNRLTAKEVEDANAEGRECVHQHLAESEAFRYTLHFLSDRPVEYGRENNAEYKGETDESGE